MSHVTQKMCRTRLCTLGGHCNSYLLVLRAFGCLVDQSTAISVGFAARYGGVIDLSETRNLCTPGSRKWLPRPELAPCQQATLDLLMVSIIIIQTSQARSPSPPPLTLPHGASWLLQIHNCHPHRSEYCLLAHNAVDNTEQQAFFVFPLPPQQPYMIKVTFEFKFETMDLGFWQGLKPLVLLTVPQLKQPCHHSKLI